MSLCAHDTNVTERSEVSPQGNGSARRVRHARVDARVHWKRVERGALGQRREPTRKQTGEVLC